MDIVGLDTERILQERIESEQELKQTVRNLKKEVHSMEEELLQAN